jgi:hypothetical protein
LSQPASAGFGSENSTKGSAKGKARENIGKNGGTHSPHRNGVPCFCPHLPEDSLFLPRYGHVAGSHFATGTGKWGDPNMMIRASGRTALILAAGLFVCFAGVSPVTAAGADSTTATSKSDSATAGKPTKQSSRHSKRDENRNSDKAASKSSERKATDGDVVDAAGGTPSAIPPSVANANAQLTSDTPSDSATAMTAKANTLLATDKPANAQAAADGQVVASDQLNDVDRALQQQNQSQPAAQAQTPPSTQPQTGATATVTTAKAAAPALSSSESPTWDQTSLIGKIFIAFGALLTMASAARMFMA